MSAAMGSKPSTAPRHPHQALEDDLDDAPEE